MRHFCVVSLVVLVGLSLSKGANAFTASTKVALVPDNHGEATGAGYLPTTDAAFSGITFTNVPLASVNAATLAAYDTVLLNQVCAPLTQFTASQRTDLVNFVNNGGKLIIYDSDACDTTPVDYSWLPFSLTTNSPGQTGSSGGTLTIVENSALGTTDNSSTAFVDTAQIVAATDAVGDANVMVTKDSHWCASMSATNVNNVTGFVRAYALYGSGIFIYNGMDTNYMSTNTAPGTSGGVANLAKLWLLELQLPNSSTLQCAVPVAGLASAPAPALGPVALGLTAVGLAIGGARRTRRRRR